MFSREGIIIIIIIDPGTQFPGNEKIRQLFLLLLLLLQYTNMLDLLTVRPKFSRPACHMQPAMRTASRCTALLLPRVLWDRQTDRRTDGHGIGISLPVYRGPRN